ncbi:HERC1, partial [Symbiodinium sp. KB8]
MEVESEGVFGFTLTLGENRWETFQIWEDGDQDKAHHSRPLYKESAFITSASMGGKRDQQWRGRDGGDGGQYSSQSWQSASQAPWRPRVPAKPQIPSYNSVVVPTQKAPRGEVLAATDGEPDELNHLQAAINAARKAEHRVLKIQKNQTMAQEQWEIFAQSLKEGWIRERKRFMKDAERLSSDLAMALDGQQRARMAVHAAYAGHPFRGVASEKVAQQEVEDAGWDSMVGDWEKEHQEGADAVLRRALESAHLPHTPTRQMLLPRTPVTRAGPDMHAPPDFGGRGPSAAAEVEDPYTFGGAHHGEPLAETAANGEMPRTAATPPVPKYSPSHPGQRDLGQPRVPTAMAPPRKDVKAATKQTPVMDTGSGSLASKLEAKRTGGSAMLPFGGGNQRAPPGLAPEIKQEFAHPIDLVAVAKIVSDDSGDDMDDARPVSVDLMGNPSDLFLVGLCLLDGEDLPATSDLPCVCSVMGGHTLPLPVCVSFPGACWILSAQGAHAMAREGWPDDLPVGRPPFVPVFTPVITEGVCDAWSPCHDEGRADRVADCLCIRDLPWSSWDEENAPDQLLGCYVYTPHYQPVAVAVRMPASADIRYALDVLLDCAPGAPEGLFTSLVPIHPQRIPGYLSVIRFHSLIRGVHDGYAAVICDLTRVGGSYFATVLPKNLSHEALVEFLHPLTSFSEDPLRFVIGGRSRLWPTEAFVSLRDGEAVTAVRQLEESVPRYRAETLRDRSTWGSMQHFFEPAFRLGTCILHRDKRFSVAAIEETGADLFDQVVSFLHLDASRTAICSFPLSDLDVHGEQCPLLVAVADVAAPTGGYREPRRQDFFVLCDLRPLGLKPQFVHAHLPRLHLPSLIADLGIALPAAFQVGVAGASLQGDVVRISCNCTILFYAKEAESDGSASAVDMSPAPDLSEPSAGRPASPWEHLGDDVEPEPSGAMHFDVTLPSDHSWNLGADEAEQVQAPQAPQANHGGQALPTPPVSFSEAPRGWSYADFCVHMAEGWDEQSDRPPVEATIPSPFDSNLPPAEVPRVAVAEAPPAAGCSNCPAPSHVAPPPAHGDDGMTTLVALVYSPDYSPEFLRVQLSLPCGIEAFLAAALADRYGPKVPLFPAVVPVFPQPFAELIILVASPAWLVARPTVLLDCQRLNQTIFACVLTAECTRESLLVAAGLCSEDDTLVFVHGLSQPLGPAQSISLVTGMTVSFAPVGSGAPATFDLATRLLTREGWNAQAPLPGPGYFPGQTFWVLTDGQPIRFFVDYRRRLCLHAELCDHLEVPTHLLHVASACPSITNAFYRGYWITDVVVATQGLSRLADPPVQCPEPRVALILDCRPILRGIRWLLLDRPCIEVYALTRLFQDQCPPEHLITITGATKEQRGLEVVFPVSSGMVLNISFEEDLGPGGSSDAPSDGPDGSPPGDYEPPPPDPANEDDGCLTGTMGSSAPRGRSRSPRGPSGSTAADGPHAALSPQGPGSRALASTVELNMVRFTMRTQIIQHVGAPGFRPLLVHMCCRLGVPSRLSSLVVMLCQAFGRAGLARGCHEVLRFTGGPWASDPLERLLSDASGDHTPAGEVYEAARRATLQLGLPWPGMPPRAPLPAAPDADGEESATSEDWMMTAATFVILTPEYAPESVDMHIMVPQSVAEALVLLDTCRGGSGRDFFPQLAPVCPQPDPRWGLVVALPDWANGKSIICLDLTLVDGRVFAVASTPVADRHTLLNYAGLSGGAEVDVYAGARDAPVHHMDAVVLAHGDCVTFVRRGEEVEFGCTLRQMLQTHLGWAPGPAFPQEAPGDRFCAVTTGFYCDFHLRPDRAPYYRSDLASRLYLSVLRMVVQPAAPRQEDVAIFGRLCRTVIAVGESWRRDDDEVGLLDCRPVLEGWWRVQTTDRWLDVGALRRNFDRHAPAGFVTVFSHCPRHWAWLWLEPGQVVRVSYARDEADTSGAHRDGESSPEDLARPGAPSGDGEHASSSRSDGGLSAPSDAVASDVSGAPTSPARENVSSVERNSAQWKDTWTEGLLHAACLPSLLWLTSVLLTVFPELTLAIGFLFCVGQPPRHRVLVALLGVSLCAASGVVAMGVADPDVRDGAGDAPAAVDLQHCFHSSWIHVPGRPIPTPCRGAMPGECLPGVRVTAPDDFACLQGCLTLLQESAMRHDCCAFFHASTLLEVLWEHLHPPGPGPTVLSLASLVPATERPVGSVTEWFSLDAGQCSLPITCEMWQELCRRTPLSSLPTLPSELKKPERFLDWTKVGAALSFPADASLVCLTSDGSFAPASGRAGWGVVVSAVTRDYPTVPGRFIGGYFGQTSDIWELGMPDAGPVNAFASELVGLYWAALMCFQLRLPCATVFRCDNRAALDIASGQATGGTHVVCRACQGLHFGLRFWLQLHPTYAHVYGHSGDPANELADALASWGETHPSPVIFDLNPHDWFREQGAPFDWVPHLCWMYRQPWAAPAMSHGMITWDSKEPDAKIPLKEQIAPFLRALPAPADGQSPSSSVMTLVFATYNTLSIAETGQVQGSSQDGLHGMVGRVALLDKSLAAQNVSLAGLQETRTPVGTTQSAHYKRYCSGCLDRRALGVELWIGIGPSCPEHSAIVLHTDNTRLVARVSVLGSHWCVFVGHAPHRGHGPAALDMTRFGSSVLMDEAGELFHQLLRRCNAWVPATFDDFFTGPGGTLVQRRSGQLARSDYMAVPLRWQDMGVWSCVDARISAGHSIPDHYAVLVGLSYRAARPSARKKHGRIDTNALLAPANEHRILEVLQGIPQVDWHTNVNDHAAVLVNSVYGRLQEMFPLKARRMSKGYLTQETALTHQCLANLRHAMRWRCHALRLAVIRCAFLAWRGHAGFSSLFQGKWLHSLRCSIAAASMKLQALGKQEVSAEWRRHFASLEGILVQPVFGKVLHKAFRRLPADLFESRAAPHQIGGRRGMSYAFGHFLSRHFLAFAKNRCISAAVIFSDLAAAYYAVVREAVVGARLCQDPIEEISRSLGLTGADLQELQAHILTEPVFDASCSELLRAFIRETHVDTWFHVSTDGEVVRTRRGTRPGSCIADVAFNLLFEKVLARRGRFDSNVVPAIPWSGSKELVLFVDKDHTTAPRVTLQDIAYADDHAMPRVCKILVLREHKMPVAVDAVPHYRHLGSVISFDGSLLPEVKQKVALAKVAFGEGRRKLFACPHIALQKRVCLCHVHVVSALLAGAGAWPLLCNTVWNLLERCVTSLCRQMLRIPAHADQHWSRAAVLVACEFPSAFDLLAAERLRFLGQLVRKGPCAAWALLQHCPDTVAAYTQAGDWLLAAVNGTCPFPDFLPHWDDWFTVMDTRQRYWKGLIKRATAWHHGRRSAWVMFDKAVRAIWQPVADPLRAPDQEDHACLLCKKAFANAQSWASHAQLQHGYRSLHFRLAEGVRCRACGSTFANLRRHRTHLQVSRRCLQSVARQDAGLLPVLELPQGHVQSRAVAGRGTSHLPPPEEDVSYSLLAKLQALRGVTDEEIFAVVTAELESLPVLRHTVRRWAVALPPGDLREAAEDVLLCLTADILCDVVARPPRSRDPVVSFRPLVCPLFWRPRPAGLPGLVLLGSPNAAADVLSITPGGGWRSPPFWLPPTVDMDFAGAWVLHPGVHWADRDASVLGPSRQGVCGRFATWRVSGKPTQVKLCNEDYVRRLHITPASEVLRQATTLRVIMSIFVDVHLLSGKCASVEVRADVLDGAQTIAEARLMSGGVFSAFAALLGDGSVVTWGSADYGGDSGAVQDQLRDVQQIQASDGAFAAILGDGSVVTWGSAEYGGDSSAVRHQLRDVQRIQASVGAFAAILGDGSVITWGRADVGGDSSAVRHQLRDVQQIQASDHAFAAILGDGSVITWGRADYGGISSAVQDQLRDVQRIQASVGAFAAILDDGSVITWGRADVGGDSSAVQDQLRDVQQIQASVGAFAAILGDGSVITWGRANFGGDSSAVRHQLRDVQQIQASDHAFAAILGDGSVISWGSADYASVGAFAAILGDGSVITWGRADYGGISSAVQDQLRDVRLIQASVGAFAAILGDGSVITWGRADVGGDSSAVRHQLRDVQQIQASDHAFAAILGDGSVVTWGSAHYLGDSIAEILTHAGETEIRIVAAFPDDYEPEEAAGEIPVVEQDAHMVGMPGDSYRVRLTLGDMRRVDWQKLPRSASFSSEALPPSSYYVAGDFNFWDFQRMEEEHPSSSSKSRSFVTEVRLRSDKDTFQVVQNKDWDQAFYPEGSATDPSSLRGPDAFGALKGWRLPGKAGDVFRIHFRRSMPSAGTDE